MDMIKINTKEFGLVGRIIMKIPFLAKIIQSTYTEGYKKGYKQGQIDYVPTVKINNVEYFDLGLPSGTLWSSAPQYSFYGWHLELKTYAEAKSLGIPTKEQWEELLKHCDVLNETYIENGVIRYRLPQITGQKGERLGYPQCKNSTNKYTTYTLGENCEKDQNKFWLLSEPDENHQVDVVVFDRGVMKYDKHFVGYKLPFFLVKQKETE